MNSAALFQSQRTVASTFHVDQDSLLRTPETEVELFLGAKTVVNILLYDPKYHEKSMDYSRDSWLLTVFAWRGRARLGTPFLLVNIQCVLVVTLVHGLKDVISSPLLDTIGLLPSTPLKLMGAGLLFLVIFHTQTAYKKWSFARNSWCTMTICCREIALQSSAYIKDFTQASRMCRYLIVYVITVRFWLRSEDLDPRLLEPILTPKGLAVIMADYTQKGDDDLELDPSLSFQFKRVCAPLMCLEIMRTILNDTVDCKGIGPFHAAMETNLKMLGTAFANAEKVLNTDIPFAYLAQVRTTILVYLSIMPLFLVMELGWYTIICVAFFSYVALGLENLSAEIETPFGYEVNDLPLDRICSCVARDIRDILSRRYLSEEAAADRSDSGVQPQNEGHLPKVSRTGTRKSTF
eukprot:TRINITY_DN65835_c0_g1_i1.p1 TRINITY_DN65835_c0_g1~~TRINITY_DN65835_c0_g1_i1.p1  ORF type:complete len:407 (-),score=19.45 TRINITY_DN65835_c0_g1_i1:187-1407(-)